MPLLKLEDFDPNYRESFNGSDIKGMGVYAEGDQKIGTVSEVLVDDQGHFRYFIVDLGFWIFGKKVLLPVGRSRVDHNADRVYAVGMTREQADNLPEFSSLDRLDYDYEEQVRGVYRTPGSTTGVNPSFQASAPVNTAAPLEASAALDAAYTAGMSGAMAPQPNYSAYDQPSAPDGAPYHPAAMPTATPSAATYNRDAYTYNQEPSLYGLNDQDHQTLKLYEERLIANKKRVKTGEVAIGKHVETETASVSVPIEKERVVIERVTPADAGRAVAPGSVDFSGTEVARVEIYEETADIHKEAFVREEIRVNKVVEQEIVQAQETLRKEELDVKTDGTPIVDSPVQLPKDRI